MCKISKINFSEQIILSKEFLKIFNKTTLYFVFICIFAC